MCVCVEGRGGGDVCALQRNDVLKWFPLCIEKSEAPLCNACVYVEVRAWVYIDVLQA